MEKLLLVEDDLALGQGVRLALQTEDRPVTLCRTLAQARPALEGEGPFALAILDGNLPDGSGLTFLAEVRGRLPVILLTANDWETDIVAGLELGAEDYITKPFSLAVLRARVNAQLRRSSGEGGTVVQVGPFTFDFGRMEYRKHGRLVDRIWTDGAEYVDEKALSVTVKRLRDKLEDTPSKPQYLKTVYGVGYTWAVV